MKPFTRFSLIALIFACSFISVYRINVVSKDEISWDVLGYYLYLPATFVHHDPMFNDMQWLKQVNEEKSLAGTLYMVSQNQKGEPMYFFLMGMALFYLPFFLGATAYSSVFGFATDGFSLPYQYFLVVGGIIYTIIGLIYFRKILLRFFSEGRTALILLVFVFGTNYINHLSLKNLETVNVLFMLTTLVIWNTIRWHENHERKHLMAIGVFITLTVLVKPSEIFLVFIPLLWNVFSMDSLKQKAKLVFSNSLTLIFTLGICLLLVLPQLSYWYIKTGKFIYDSYVNPGVGLDFKHPHIVNILFSYRKGWFLYTPIIIFPLIGFYFLYRNNRSIFFACLVYFLLTFYTISSWSEWWYGAGFSARPFIATYPVLAICFGYFQDFLSKQRVIFRVGFGIVVVFCIFLNQFQWWQYRNYILDPYRTTKEYYWATFLKTEVTDADRELLLVERDFNGKVEFKHPEKYNGEELLNRDFEQADDTGTVSENGNRFYRLDEGQEFFNILEQPYEKISADDHFWIKVKADVRFPKGLEGATPCLAMSMDRAEGQYGYAANEIRMDSAANEWRTVEMIYLTPEIRSHQDRFKLIVWKRGKSPVDIDNIKVKVFRLRNE